MAVQVQTQEVLELFLIKYIYWWNINLQVGIFISWILVPACPNFHYRNTPIERRRAWKVGYLFQDSCIFSNKKFKHFSRTFKDTFPIFQRLHSVQKRVLSLSFLVLPQYEQFYPEGLSVFAPFRHLRIWVGWSKHQSSRTFQQGLQFSRTFKVHVNRVIRLCEQKQGFKSCCHFQ